MVRATCLFILCMAFGVDPAEGAIPRPVEVVGNIIAVKGDEQIRLVATADWLPAEIEQDLTGGDALQTGRFGGLAILFRDRTQIRVHRNSMLVVKEIAASGGAGQSRLRLEQGAVWTRGHPAGDGFRMETPAANLAIRGTDWALTVDERGLSTLIVLSGEIEFFNAYGSVRVRRGEIATAAVGKAPTKTFLVNPRDRPQWQLEVGIGWLDLFSITGLRPSELNKRRSALAQSPGRKATAGALLELATLSFDLREHAATRRYLEPVRAEATLGKRPEILARIRLLQGFLRLQERAPDQADTLFTQALPELPDRWRRMAELGRFQARVEQGRYQDAEALLFELLHRYGEYPETHLAAIWLHAFQGAQERAIQEALTAQRRFAQDARFPILLGYLYLLTDRPEAVQAAIATALALDSEQVFGWTLKGLYHQRVEAEPERAIRAYRRALELVPATASAWSNLGTVYTELGEYRKAESAFQSALRADPQSAGHRANYALLLIYLDRPRQAEPLVREALALDPSHSTVLQGLGYLALSLGRTEEAIDWILKATTVNPGLADADTQLGIAYYQAGRRQAAEQALDAARRLDPRDPIPDLVGSVTAQNYAEAGEAIRYSRQAFRKYQEWKNYSVETLASDRNGTINVGSAYANLGLAAWGNYYAQLSFDPYWANSHFGAKVLYESIQAQRGSDVQGLLLDPLAYATRFRYTDLVRRPFHDLRLAAQVGWRGGAFTDTELVNLNGFSQSPMPFSYQLTLGRLSDNGFRTNGDRTDEFAEFSAGVKLDEENSLLLGLTGSRSRFGFIGPEDQPDLNEREIDKFYSAVLGYQHRFGPRNRLLARAAMIYGDTTFRNPDPFGSGLTDLEFSLIRAFGVDATRTLFDLGLFDASAIFNGTPANPVLVFGPLGVSLGLTPLEGGASDSLDLNPLRGTLSNGEVFQLQLRHLFDVGPLEITYGAEWLGRRTHFRSSLNGFLPLGTGSLTNNGSNFTPFPFATLVRQALSSDVKQDGVRAYLGSRWKITEDFWLEDALFLSYYSGVLGDQETELDPKIGFAWRLTPNHWLRAAAQRELYFLSETLAPVATVGLTIPVADAVNDAGFSITDVQLQWDAEWSPFLFTFAQLERRTLEAKVASPTAGVEKSRINRATVGASVWFLERFGLSAIYRRFWSENLTTGPYRGNDVPDLAEEQFGIGLKYIHPRQVEVSLLQLYTGERSADLENSSTLEGYWTTNGRITWQPYDKHWRFVLNAENLLDKNYETLQGFPAPGRIVEFYAEYRF